MTQHGISSRLLPFSFRLPALILVMLQWHPGLQAQTVFTSADSRVAQPIVNGQTTIDDAQPWMVALVRSGPQDISLKARLTCGGTLIEPLWVVTAAHCVDDAAASDLIAVIGRNNLEDSKGELLRITEIIVNPDWQGSGHTADFALLRLAEPSTSRPLPIADPEMLAGFYNQDLTVFGWGNTFDDRAVECKVVMGDGFRNLAGYVCETLTSTRTNNPPALQNAAITLKTGAQCNQRSTNYFRQLNLPAPQRGDSAYVDPDSNGLCGWNETDASTPCFGDSGGPLVGNVGGKDYLAGVVSRIYLNGCRLEQQIGFYANAALFSDFIARAKFRDPSLGFEGFCPASVQTKVSYSPTTADRKRVTVAWDAVGGANRYTLYFSPVPQSGDFVGQKHFPGNTNEFSLELRSGQRFLVAMQAHTAGCDGALSAPLEIALP